MCHQSVSRMKKIVWICWGEGEVGGFGAFPHLAGAFCSVHCKFLTCLRLEYNNLKYSTGACVVLFLVKCVWVTGLVLASHTHTHTVQEEKNFKI